MAISLVLGIAALIAWAMSTWVYAVSLNGSTKLLPAPWIRTNLENGGWYMAHNMWFDINDGWLSFNSFPVHGDYFESPDNAIEALIFSGYVQVQPDDPILKEDGVWSINWNEPITSTTSWALRATTDPQAELKLNLLATAGVLTLPPLIWFLVRFRHVFSRRLRMQTNLCLHCNYNLTGVEGDSCPECGAARPMATLSSRG